MEISYTVDLPTDAVLLTLQEVCAYLGVSENTLRQELLYHGGPPKIYLSERQPRYPLAGVIQWIQELEAEQQKQRTMVPTE